MLDSVQWEGSKIVIILPRVVVGQRSKVCVEITPSHVQYFKKKKTWILCSVACHCTACCCSTLDPCTLRQPKLVDGIMFNGEVTVSSMTSAQIRYVCYSNYLGLDLEKLLTQCLLFQAPVNMYVRTYTNQSISLAAFLVRRLFRICYNVKKLFLLFGGN